MNWKTFTPLALLLILLSIVGWSNDLPATDIGMFGGTPSRNMVSSETNLPERWDTETGLNVKWTAALGSQSYAGPLVVGGQVYVGTNNEGLRNPKLTGDRGVLLAFRESDGGFLWQAAHPKLEAGRVNDWPMQGVCSTPYVEGNRLYYISNRCEVVCADTEGFRDGENDGPYKDETETGEEAVDIVWKLDMMAELDVFPHNLAASSPVGAGDQLFTLTSNGVDEDHITIPSPFAPSFLAIDKKTGKVNWEDGSPGDRILHGQWGNPSYGIVKGKPQVIFPGGDGWLYSFDPETGKLIWKFDCNPKGSTWVLGGRGTKNNLIASPVIYNDRVYIGVGQDPEHGEGVGHLYALDATLQGDVTDKAVIWHFGDGDFNRTISTVAIHDGLLYASDLSGFLYCLDVETGKHYWTYDSFAAVWGSPLVADGKIYLGDEDGDVAVLKTGKTKEVLYETNLGASIYTTPVAKNGVLFIASRTTLFALENK
jgi:outer membrane protein assembly factor BamB